MIQVADLSFIQARRLTLGRTDVTLRQPRVTDLLNVIIDSRISLVPSSFTKIEE